MFVLIHSPIVGPFTWALVAAEFRQRGIEVVVPNLHERAHDAGTPYWAQHAAAVALTLTPQSDARSVILVGHSGAGMLLPAVRQLTERPIGGYLFVDAGIPEDGRSRLDLFENHEAVQQFRAAAAHGLLPAWTDDDLRKVIPNDEVRKQFVAELRPMPLAVYEEPLPVCEQWPDAPCGYLQFSSIYDKPAEQARQMGWAYRKLAGGHFHMLVNRAAVADAMLGLITEMKIENI